MQVRSFTRIILLMLATISLSGCFKKWEYEEVQSWYDKKPENFDEYMQFAREKVSQGKSDKAMQYYHDGMKLIEGMYGPKDPRIATAAEELAVLQENSGMLVDAENSWKKALEVRSKTLSAHSADLIRTRKRLSEVLLKEFKSEEAKAVLSGTTVDKLKDKAGTGDKTRKRRHNI